MMLITLMAMALAVSAFKPKAGSRTQNARSALGMASSFGVQKLGEKVIEPTTKAPPSEEEDDENLGLLGDHVGSGMDERMPALTAADITNGLDEISRIDKSFRQQSLMMTLGDTSVLGTMDKAERVQLGAQEGLLPDMFAQTVSSPQMMSGGLMDDWEFDTIA